MTAPTAWAVVRLADHAVMRDGCGQGATVNAGEALWPIVDQQPSYDVATQRLGPVALTVDIGGERVLSAPTVLNLTEDEASNRAAYALASTLARRLAELADYRWRHETASLVFGDATYLMDRDSQGQISTLYFAAKANELPNGVAFKSASGFVQLSQSDLLGLGLAGLAQVQGAFAVEGIHDGALRVIAAADGATDAEVAAYDITTGWPA